MANNFKALALNAPSECKLSMIFKLPNPCTIHPFLQKINFADLLLNVSYWQNARFKFLVHGFNRDNHCMLKEIEVSPYFMHSKREQVAEAVLNEFVYHTRINFIEDPYIVHMEINFPSGI